MLISFDLMLFGDNTCINLKNKDKSKWKEREEREREKIYCRLWAHANYRLHYSTRFAKLASNPLENAVSIYKCAHTSVCVCIIRLCM